MAKKGGVQQLQTEINTSEELTKFLEKDGLLILDVYTEWCGPCLAMVGCLKKIKLEQGGDDLQLAIVKCDNISVFERFRNRSEPTWLFASKCKLVNSAFGSNAPELMSLITEELAIERDTQKNPINSSRQYHDLAEMTLKELERHNRNIKLQEEVEKIEQEVAHRQRQEYLTFVTDRIMSKAGDCGVTIFLPHLVGRDLFKKVSDPADKFQLTARDKKNAQIMEEHLEVIHFDCDNPLPKYVIDHLLKKDIFMVCWRLNDNESRSIEEVLTEYVLSIAHDQEIKDEFGVVNSDARVPALLKSLSLMVEVDEEDELLRNNEEQPDMKSEINGIGSTSKDNKQSGAAGGPKDNKDDVNRTMRENQSLRKIKTKVIVPGAWTPSNKRAHAAMIYLYFRNLTEVYLPPDPPPQKPHLTLVFDSYKRKELMDIIEQHPDEVLAYGYFTSDDPSTAILIANSTFLYQKVTPTIHDKMILKVAKQPGDAILSLVAIGPSYMSRNTEIGKTECIAFFPPGYTVASETGEPDPVLEEEKPTKKKKKKKQKHAAADEVDNLVESEQPVEQEESELGDEEEGDDDDEQEVVCDSVM